MLLHVCTQPKRPDGTGGGRGKRVGGVLRYLFGPGREEEHVNSRYGEGPLAGTPYGRLIAASGSTPMADLQPQRTDRGHFDFRPLVDWLQELPRAAGVLRRVDGKRDGPGWVWHASLRLAPQDRHRQLSDQMWTHIVGETLRGAGLVVDGDDLGVRWVVVRHADDHVHIVATLVREDLRREWFRNDFTRCIEAVGQVAARMGLRQVTHSGGSTHRRPHPVEVHKAARHGRFTRDGAVLTVRDELRRRVRAAAAAADGPDTFVARLQAEGVRVEFRYSEIEPGRPSGVKFALAADATAAGAPVWYGGGKLAPELTWPKLCARWSAVSLPGLDNATLAGVRDRDRVLAEADRIVRRAATGIGNGRGGDADAVGQAAADCMSAGAWLLDQGLDGRLVHAAEQLDQATRQPRGHRRPPAAEVARLHLLAQALFGLQQASDDDEARQALRMMYSLAVLAERIARLRDQQQWAEQAVHARAAAAQVRRSRPRRERGRRLTGADRARYAEAVRQVLPEQAERLLAEPGWDALAATMRDLETRGADLAEMLRTVAGWRRLGTAHSISRVLVWRLRRRGALHEPATLTDAGPTSRDRQQPRPPRHDPTADHAHRPAL